MLFVYKKTKFVIFFFVNEKVVWRLRKVYYSPCSTYTSSFEEKKQNKTKRF